MMLRSPSAALLIVLVVLMVIPASAYQVYIGPGDGTGRIIKDPPSEEKIQEMIEERARNHPSLFKSRDLIPDLAAAKRPFQITTPTSNMHDYDVLYYKINIEIDMDSETIEGYVEMRLKNLIDGLSSVDLTLNEFLSVTDVRLDGVSQAFSHSTSLLTVFLDETFDSGDELTLRVDYGGFPQYYYLYYAGGMFFFYYDDQKVAFTFAEPFGARGWWPCKDFTFDKPDSIDVAVTHPTVHEGNPMSCASNGVLVSVVDNGNGTTTTHWSEKHPIATYLVALVITEFEEITQSWEYAPGESMPVRHFHYPSIPPSETWGSTYYMVNYTLPALDALSYWWGTYPFYDEKYGHMQDLAGGAMEHQTCTSIHAEFNTEWVIAHELAHQWAGDQVTCSPFNHMWLNEGFASYGEVLYIEYLYGWSNARLMLASQRHINAGSPYVENLATENVFDGETVYDKGSWLVHMLRHQMGDTLFFPAMQYYFHDSEFAGGSASTDDLNSVVSDFYGCDMSWFFDAWVYQEGQPNYRYFYDYTPEPEARDGYDVLFFLEQNNIDGIFPMNVEIHAYAGDYDTLYRVRNEYEATLYEFHLPNPPDSFKIDPDEKILRTVQEVPAGMRIVTGGIPDAIVGEPYSFSFEAMWGVPDYQWEKLLGQFPSGLTFNENTGELSGTPTWVSESFFRLRCTDSDSPPNVDVRDFTMSIVEPPPLCGDCDASGEISVDDVVFLLNFIFNGGPAPDPIEIGDVDDSDSIDIDDAVYLIMYLFMGGPPPIE
jgi:hypothetical protein